MARMSTVRAGFRDKPSAQTRLAMYMGQARLGRGLGWAEQYSGQAGYASGPSQRANLDIPNCIVLSGGRTSPPNLSRFWKVHGVSGLKTFNKRVIHAHRQRFSGTVVVQFLAGSTGSTPIFSRYNQFNRENHVLTLIMLSKKI